ncbi:glycerol-3-phosphate responsive antiterminator [Bacillaceae bacterium SIJ1]|uniref:glycerol-3-phosphate responsive antiterminator n=1 Tax=Litoribacterium kuwaitense TaxID=1398745 RepID=UPI0013EABCE1|nr:glycerol-3-phosphate responsive antiterminator [Litoribacterium kuwaitense]NGP46059.1 glycerol-3-phosphate responsive antiterminator [Litoribacterium kuwaitense]
MDKGNRHTKSDVLDRLHAYQKVASLKDIRWIERALQPEISCVFLETGTLSAVKRYVNLFDRYGIPVFLHIEKIAGINTDRHGVEFLAHHVKPTGIITSKPKLVRYAQQYRLLSVLRMPLLDRESIDRGLKTVEESGPDIVQVLPASAAHFFQPVADGKSVPVIAGGLIETRGHAEDMLASGALAVSTSSPELWMYSFARKTEVKQS